MAFSTKPFLYVARLLAVVALVHGIASVFFILGATGGLTNPISELGIVAFAVIILSALLRLLAAVGLWSLTAWGGVLLFVANILELGTVFMHPNWLPLNAFEIGVRILVLLAVVTLLGWVNWDQYKHRNHL